MRTPLAVSNLVLPESVIPRTFIRSQNFGPAPLTIKLLILSAKLRFQCRRFPGRFGQVGPSQSGRDATQVHGFRQREPEPMGQPAYRGKHLQPAVDLRSSVRSGLIIRGLTKAGAGAA